MSGHTPLPQRTIGDYLETLGSSQSTPGGGSVAGLVGAMAAGLGQMVVSLTVKGESNPVLDGQFETLGAARESLLAAAAADERAYGAYVDATRMSKSTDEEKAQRRTATQAALVNAASVPLILAEAACGLLTELGPVVRDGTAYALADAEIAVGLAHASVAAGLVTVRVNIPLIKDEAKAGSLAAQADMVERRANQEVTSLRATLAQRRRYGVVGEG
ncbi:MAG: cyclodeaminase/cyclohydrolase family protein [Chloroflexia bacterium]|nr:cyclodeaminase/cyclohydrolase family protein [Chloroflexia bacterium]